MGLDSRTVSVWARAHWFVAHTAPAQPVWALCSYLSRPHPQAWAPGNEPLGRAGSQGKWERGRIISFNSNGFSLLFFVVGSWLWLQRRSGETHISERQGPCTSALAAWLPCSSAQTWPSDSRHNTLSVPWPSSSLFHFFYPHLRKVF